MAEGSESLSGRKKQLGTIYLERNLGKLDTEAFDHGTSEGDLQSSRPPRQLGKLLSSDEEEENINKSVDQANYSQSSEGESITEPPRQLGKLWTPSKRNAIVLFDGKSGFLHRFDPVNNSLMKKHEMKSQIQRGPHGNSWFSAVSLGDWIYVLNRNRSVYRLRYSDKTATWERMSDMIEDHGIQPPAVASLESIYVVGGSGYHFSSSVGKYDSVTNQWARLKNKRQSTRNSGVLTSGGYVYCFGGELKQGGYQNSVQRFPFGSASWERLPPMNEGKANMGVTEFCGDIYVMGGNYDRMTAATNERYDPATKHWTMLRPMRISRGKFQCFSIEGCIYAVGGETSSSALEKYDVEKNRWEMVDLPCEENLSILDSVTISLYD